MTRMHFIRHAHSLSNLDGMVTSRPPGTGLAPSGAAAADKLASSVAILPGHLVASSPLRRAVETADRVVAGRPCHRAVIEDLREFEIGDLEGRTDEAARQQLWSAWTEWFEKGNLDHAPALGAESGTAALNRFKAAIAEAHSAAVMTGAEQVWLVGHGTLLQLGLTWVCSNIEVTNTMDRWIPNLGIVTADYADGELDCITWGNTNMSGATA